MSTKLLVPIDLSQSKAIDVVFPEAIDLAHSRDARLHLLTVVPDSNVGMWPSLPRGFMDDAKDEAAAQLKQTGAEYLPDDVDWEAEAVIGPVPRSIVEKASQIRANMIVIASHDPKIVDIVLGSVADRVVRRAHCSVLVVRDASRELM